MTSILSLSMDIVECINDFMSEESDIVNLRIALDQQVLDNNVVFVKGRDISYYDHSISLKPGSNMITSGFCYLKSVVKKYQAFRKHGMYIKTKDLISVMLEFTGTKNPIYHSGGGLTDTCHFIDYHKAGYHTLRYQHMMTNTVVPLTEQVIRKIRNHSEWRVHMIQGSRIGGTGTFTLKDLALSQSGSVEFNCPEAKHYFSQGKRTEPVSVVRDGSNLIIKTEDVTVDFKIGDDILRKIPHEYVAGCLSNSTDMPLSELGIQGEESVLTPDFIDVQTRTVLELGTTMADNLNSLYNDFEGKVRKYSYLLKPINCSTYYLIVGMNKIVSNLDLRQDTVDELCARFRIGQSIKSQISDLISDTDISDEDSENIRVAKSIFYEMGSGSLEDTYDYNIQEILDASSEPKDKDFKHTGETVKTCLKSSRTPKPQTRQILTDYLATMKSQPCRQDKKRITNVPVVLYDPPESYNPPSIEVESSDLPTALKSLWRQAGENFKEVKNSQDDIDKMLQGNYPEQKHTWKRESLFSPNFSLEDRISLAERGVGAKALSENDRIISHEKISKMGFDPDSPTLDINDFIHTSLLNNTPKSIRTPAAITNILSKSKSICTNGTNQDSPKIFLQLLRTNLIKYADMISEIFTELAINYKHWTKGKSYMIKQTRSGIFCIIRNTGTHLFCSFAFPRSETTIIDTGRLGPTLYASSSHYFTDFSSYNEPTIEHFVKAGPYITSILCHLQSKFKLSIGELNNDKLSTTINFILLLYLNNKLDAEELLTSQRYLFMKLLEDATQDPYTFTERLPLVLRSRFSVYILSKTMILMDYYSCHKIIKIPKKDNDITIYDYLNIKSIVDGSEISLEEKINEFYYGYVISKERARGSDRTYKIMKKILQEEYKFRDSVKTCFSNMMSGPVTYATDPSILRVTLHYFKQRLSELAGDDFKKTHLNDFSHKLALTSFVDLATLKASSKHHESDIKMPEIISSKRSEIFSELKKLNSDEASKRPKVLEALIAITDQYYKETGKDIRHVMQMIPWALKELEAKGHFDSDIFPKPQHGGDREIHVLEIKARLVQFGIELISKTFCSYFPSEVLTHPETKGRFVQDHYQETSRTFKSYFVISKSADASKWCQRHHSSHFSAMLLSITHKSLHNYVLRVLRLWSTKKVSFPLQFMATLLKNEHAISGDKTFNRFREEFYKGGKIINAFSNKMEIKSGMMQGILHYTSSLYHTMIQEVCKIIVVRIAIKLGSPITCSIVQGSDDSGMMIGVALPMTQKLISRMYMLLRFKEEFSQYLSVYWNLCKSSIGTIDLIEFNSEWYLRHSIIKPTFRWVSACMELSITEKFVDRYRMCYNVLSQCLEGGSSTLECAIIQLCQGWLHYIMLGLYNKTLGDIASQLLLSKPTPSLGFFPLDFDVCCGLPGIDFILYNLFCQNIYTPISIQEESNQHFDYDGSDKILMSRDLKSVKLRFGKLYIWKSLVERISIGTLESALQAVESDPMILFKTQYSWKECIPKMILKVFEPGVKESLNNISSVLRMVASSGYILDRPCITQYNSDGKSYQESLLRLLFLKNEQIQTQDNPDPRLYFPLHADYAAFLTTITEFTQNHMLYKQGLRKTSKVKIRVFTTNVVDHDIMGLCRRAWNLGGRVLLSSRQFRTIWSQTKLQYTFLKETLEETKAYLNMTTLEVKVMIEKITQKNREVTLMDSTGRDSNLELSLTRIYWPDTKLRSSSMGGITECLRLKSFLFSLTTYWMTPRRSEEIAKRAISTCHSLDKPYKDIPVKFRKLKTLYDWSHNVNKVNLIMQIKSQKQSAIGFFSQPQKMESGKPKGYGYWIGQVVGIQCHLELMDDTVTRVIVQQLSDLKSLGKALSLLIKEIKMTRGNQTYKSNVWLSKNGKISTTKPQEDDPIPIEEDRSLIAEVITAMEELPWSLQIHNTTVRLVVTEIIDSSPMTYTILSESLSSRDWNPDLFINSPDTLLNMWNNSIPSNMMEIELNISSNIPETPGAFRKFMKTLSSTPTIKSWDLSLFRKRALSQITKTSNIAEFELHSETNIKTIKEMDDFLDRIFSMTQDSVNRAVQWSEDLGDMQEWESNLHIELTDDTISTIKSFTDSMKDVTFDEDSFEDETNKWYQMPYANRFFSNLEKLCLIQTGTELKQVLKDIKAGVKYSIDGTLGKVISLLSAEFVYKGVSDIEETFDMVSQSSRALDTLLSDTEISQIDTIEISNAIQQLEEASKYLSGIAKDEVETLISRKRRLLILKDTSQQVSDLEDLSYSDFMTTIIDHVFSHSLTKFSYYDVDIGLKLSLLKIEMSELIRHKFDTKDISLQEHTIMREYINRSIISPYLIDILQECYSFKLDLTKMLQSKVVSDMVILL